jgi:acyl carrier protein
VSPDPTLDSNARLGTDVATTVREVLAQYTRRSLDEISLDSRLEHDLELDSFALIEIDVALETSLGFSMDDESDPHDLNLHTVGDLVTYVSGRLASRKPPEGAAHASANNRRA